jgi:hypothetical protein
VVLPVDQRYVIGVELPLGNAWQECVRVPEVEQGWIAPSGPPAGAASVLQAGTTRAAAERIAECIRSRLEPASGEVVVEERAYSPPR